MPIEPTRIGSASNSCFGSSCVRNTHVANYDTGDYSLTSGGQISRTVSREADRDMDPAAVPQTTATKDLSLTSGDQISRTVSPETD